MGKQLALWIDQNIASEIYLLGKLIYSFGKVSSKTEENLANNPAALPVWFPTERIFELVRLFFQLLVFLIMGFGNKMQARGVMGYLVIPFIVFFIIQSVLVTWMPL